MTLSGTITHLLFFGGSLALIMAIVQIFQIFRDSKHLWLCIFFLCISIIGFQQYYMGMYRTPHLELSLMQGQAVLFMLGPSIFLFYKKQFYRDFKLRYIHIIHFIPPIGSACIDLFMSATTSTTSIAVLQVRSKIIQHNYYYIISAGIIFIVYNVYILVKEDFLTLMKQKVKNKINQIALFFIIMVLVITILLVYSVSVRSVLLTRFFMTLMIIPFIFIFFVGYLNPGLIHIFISEVKKNMYERSLIKGLDIEALKNRLDDLMQEDKIFCDEDLNLKRLAGILSITSHQLSEFLNKHMNISFNYYINRYRVEEAINLLRTQPERSITSICYSVGFNSRSSFYDAFSKFAGISPAKYRKIIKKQTDF